MSESIAVIGLGYVGLPLLLGVSSHFEDTVGFDINQKRVADLTKKIDATDEADVGRLATTTALFTSNPANLKNKSFYIVVVPTPVDQAKRPDMAPLEGACKAIGLALKNSSRVEGAPLPLVVFESTVYPGLTEEFCGPLLEHWSGLRLHQDFKLGYSPERINPGDKKNHLETIVKVISAEDEDSLNRMANVYGCVVRAGLYKASSIKIAEAAKVLENTQRDINIALMNELALICDKLDIRTSDVLSAAATKWNFLPFTPGLVGGHCIGVDPYYLAARAEEVGVTPQVVLAGRRVNDGMPVFIAQKLAKLTICDRQELTKPKIGMLGLAFKENVRDLRNSKVPDIVREMEAFGMDVMVHDPLVDPAQAYHEYGIRIQPKEKLNNLDVLVLAVPHEQFLSQLGAYVEKVRPKGLIADIKSAIDPKKLPSSMRYWSL